VALADDPLLHDADRSDHQQPQVADDVGRQLVVGDVGAVDVEPEPLALQPAAVGELDLEIELDAVVLGRGRQSSRTIRRLFGA
jgi:hypothetical protein